MSNFDFERSADNAAKQISNKYSCPVHGEKATYNLNRTSQGVNVQWNFCCDELGDMVKANFTNEINQSLKKEVDDSIKSIFKNSKFLKIR